MSKSSPIVQKPNVALYLQWKKTQ